MNTWLVGKHLEQLVVQLEPMYREPRFWGTTINWYEFREEFYKFAAAIGHWSLPALAAFFFEKVEHNQGRFYEAQIIAFHLDEEQNRTLLCILEKLSLQRVPSLLKLHPYSRYCWLASDGLPQYQTLEQAERLLNKALSCYYWRVANSFLITNMSQICLHCKVSFIPQELVRPELCCNNCIHRNEIQCYECESYYRATSVCMICDGYEPKVDSCDVCRIVKHTRLLGKGKCIKCYLWLDICHNCLGTVRTGELDLTCAKCRLCEWSVDGLTQEWLQQPNIKVVFK